MSVDDSHMSLAERRCRREHRLPMRFRDIVPQPLPLLPPSPEIMEIPFEPTHTSPSPPLAPSSSTQTSSNPSLVSRVLRTYHTPRNLFGLYRLYRSVGLPIHDPEEHITLQDHCDESIDYQDPNAPRDHLLVAISRAFPQGTENPFYPFPNESSFRLGNWYWNHGVQKSRENFRELLSVVGNPEFRPDDIRGARWDEINKKLGRNDFDERDADNVEGGWMDEDAGWTKTPINISVPFHSRTKNPGPQNYLAGHLYHRPLVSVIQEKIANTQDNRHFHYEPFEIFWRPTETSPDVRVHGELYTSPAFVEANRQIQEAPGEPGCNLPRVIVAMMFWSDVTHLTQFGNAQLWPSYLYFGNESKYRRCKPSCHLCSHVAYFEIVSCCLCNVCRLFSDLVPAPRCL